MRYKRSVLLTSLTILILSLMIDSAFSRSNTARTPSQAATIEEITKIGNKAVREGDWVSAESHFREAVRLAPKQGFWRIQLILVLGQQKRWKAAFAEMDPLVRNGAANWVLTVNKTLPEGNVAFLNAETFGNEQQGITRYVKAVKENEKVDSVSRDIRVKLNAYARQHGIALMYDISKFKTLPFESGSTTDVTSDFIAYYNGSEYVEHHHGTVYLYRAVDTHDHPHIVTMNPEAMVYLEGREFLFMPERTSIGFKVPVGSYVIHMSWKGYRSAFDIEANTTYYLRVSQVVYPTFFQTIDDVDETTALEEIRKTNTLKEKNIRLKRFEAIRTTPTKKQSMLLK